MTNNFAHFVDGIYGQLRGYNRWNIRRAVYRNATATRDAMDREAKTKLAARVTDAIERFPEYADKVKQFRGALPNPGDVIDPIELPVWTRADQVALFDRLKGPPIDGAYVHSTGGSTGVPMRFYVSRESYEWRTAVADRGYSWAWAEEGVRSLYLWGMAEERTGAGHRIKRSVHLWLQRRIWIDGYQVIADDHKEWLCGVINRYRPSALVVYANMGVQLARFVRDHPGKLNWRANSIVVAAEGLQPGQRELLSEQLGGEVFMSYGSREGMLIGMECDRHTGYHLSSDNLMVEVADDDGKPVKAGTPGHILITDLNNAATPFIRYDNGDLGTMAPDEACPCGLPFARLASVDGRSQDVIYTSDGNEVSAVYVTFVARQFKWIEGYQVVQDSKDRILVKLITRDELTEDLTRPVTQMLQERLGASMKVDYARVSELTRRENGKVELVVSKVSE